MYYIKKIELQTENYSRTEINLQNGLNIICGPSNTGKSLILECIDFMFGGDAEKLTSNPIGFTKICFELSVNNETVILSREIGKKEITVESSTDLVEDGIYKTGNAKKNTSKLWLSLMGINDEVEVIQKADYSPQKLGVRTFIHTFLIKESRMVGDDSILQNGIGFKGLPISTITSLLYLATENNFLEGHSKINKKLIDEKNKAVQAFVDKSLQSVANQRMEALKHTVDEISPEEITNKINLLMDEIDVTNNELDEANKKNQLIANRIFIVDNKIAESSMLKNRYAALLTQYESDIKRLTFIAEGEIHKDILPKIDHCPFCNGELTKNQEESCMEAAINEVNNIEKKLNDLKSVYDNIEAEIQSQEIEKSQLLKDQKIVQDEIRGVLEPKINDLRNLLARYRVTLGSVKINEIYDSFESTLNKELKNTIISSSEPEHFDVRSVINEYLADKLDTRLLAILKASNFENISSAVFDIEKCDVIVNGASKKTHGKGYKAYLNTVMAIALQECLEDYNRHYPQLLALDSPILSLVEKQDPDDSGASDKMKKGLFKYLVEHSNTRQIIVVENNIPDINYGNTNIIEFTKSNEGRYGLIPNYRH